MTAFTSHIVSLCQAELQTFKGGKLKETDAAIYKRVGDYWAAVPAAGLDGRTVWNDSKGKPYRPAWSAAFVSFVLKQAGVGTRFKTTKAHCHYVEAARAAVANNAKKAYHAVDPYSAVPSVGDIVVAGREYAEQLTFKQAELAYKADGFYPSHGDFVVEVDAQKSELVVVGGNVGDSVKPKRLLLSPKGRLVDRQDGGKVLPWLALLRCQL
jgi:hypothetical protein